ncbi:hypothetical protein Vadar_021654 [Vaccinium darrowii]|uniref:Uncharacterized protein n=1 Tax=Vaccinium darrowii TaxID=229202 RepID=A0ACB7XBS0_9ERIC|nr:hypothetical protein Vadar_021654 [Vaccinium darrowii]
MEGYYSIIQEQMGFSTMRAKLQEEIGTTLEQFEACAIYEMANRVNTLKTEPQKIELEFSLMRKLYARKPRGEYGGSSFKLGAKLRANNPAYCGSAGANAANPHDNEILPGMNLIDYSPPRRNFMFPSKGNPRMYAV